LVRGARRYRLDDWRGIGFLGQRGRAGPASGPGRATDSRPGREAIPLGLQLLSVLYQQGSASGSAGAGYARRGLTEAQVAAKAGMSRDRFSRALRRLCEEGQVERVAVRPVGGSRRVFLYRLTPEGEQRARAIVVS